jgi:hypothetical protein
MADDGNDDLRALRAACLADGSPHELLVAAFADYALTGSIEAELLAALDVVVTQDEQSQTSNLGRLVLAQYTPETAAAKCRRIIVKKREARERREAPRAAQDAANRG